MRDTRAITVRYQTVTLLVGDRTVLFMLVSKLYILLYRTAGVNEKKNE